MGASGAIALARAELSDRHQIDRCRLGDGDGPRRSGHRAADDQPDAGARLGDDAGIPCDRNRAVYRSDLRSRFRPACRRHQGCRGGGAEPENFVTDASSRVRQPVVPLGASGDRVVEVKALEEGPGLASKELRRQRRFKKFSVGEAPTAGAGAKGANDEKSRLTYRCFITSISRPSA